MAHPDVIQEGYLLHSLYERAFSVSVSFNGTDWSVMVFLRGGISNRIALVGNMKEALGKAWRELFLGKEVPQEIDEGNAARLAEAVRALTEQSQGKVEITNNDNTYYATLIKVKGANIHAWPDKNCSVTPLEAIKALDSKISGNRKIGNTD